MGRRDGLSSLPQADSEYNNINQIRDMDTGNFINLLNMGEDDVTKKEGRLLISSDIVDKDDSLLSTMCLINLQDSIIHL